MTQYFLVQGAWGFEPPACAPPGEPGAFERDPRKALRAAMHAVVTQLSALGAEGVSIWVPNSFDFKN